MGAVRGWTMWILKGIDSSFEGRHEKGGDILIIRCYLLDAFLVVLSHSCFLTSIPSSSPSADSGESMVKLSWL